MIRLTSMFLLAITCNSALAFGLKDFTNAMTESVKTGAKQAVGMDSETNAELSESGDILIDYIASAKLINEAQISLAKAFDLKEEIAELESQQALMEDGQTLKKDSIKKITDRSIAVNQLISEKIEQKAVISSEKKKHFRASLLPYSLGVYQLNQVVKNATSLDDYSTGGFMSKLGKATTTLYIARSAPSYFKSLFGTSRMMMTYARANNIKVPSKAQDTIGELEDA